MDTEKIKTKFSIMEQAKNLISRISPGYIEQVSKLHGRINSSYLSTFDSLPDSEKSFMLNDLVPSAGDPAGIIYIQPDFFLTTDEFIYHADHSQLFDSNEMDTYLNNLAVLLLNENVFFRLDSGELDAISYVLIKNEVEANLMPEAETFVHLVMEVVKKHIPSHFPYETKENTEKEFIKEKMNSFENSLKQMALGLSGNS